MTSTDAPTMHVKIYSPFKTYYDGQANSLSAVTVRAPGKDDFRLNITRGVMHVKSDKTTLFLDV
jgi:hypothetical protein